MSGNEERRQSRQAVKVGLPLIHEGMGLDGWRGKDATSLRRDVKPQRVASSYLETAVRENAWEGKSGIP